MQVEERAEVAFLVTDWRRRAVTYRLRSGDGVPGRAGGCEQAGEGSCAIRVAAAGPGLMLLEILLDGRQAIFPLPCSATSSLLVTPSHPISPPPSPRPCLPRFRSPSIFQLLPHIQSCFHS